MTVLVSVVLTKVGVFKYDQTSSSFSCIHQSNIAERVILGLSALSPQQAIVVYHDFPGIAFVDISTPGLVTN